MTLIKKLIFISNQVRNSIPKDHRYIDNHYVLECKKQEVLVFTRHPKVNAIVINKNTILGNPGPQYLNKTLYKIDESNSKLVPAPVAETFEKENISVLKKAQEDSSNYDLVDISKIITDK